MAKTYPAALALSDMRNAIRKAREYLGSRTVEQIEADDMRLDALIRQTAIVCEVAKERLPADLIARHPNIPWKHIAGMGDVLRHQYHRIDVAGIVTTVRDSQDFDDLLAVIEAEIGP